MSKEVSQPKFDPYIRKKEFESLDLCFILLSKTEEKLIYNQSSITLIYQLQTQHILSKHPTILFFQTRKHIATIAQ